MEIKCPQCGGDVKVIEGETFLTCDYCSSAIYIDKSKVVFHYMLKPTIDEAGAAASLRRWMAGSSTAKGLENEAKMNKTEFIYFPIWYFKIKQADKELIKIQPASSSPITGIKSLVIPAGDFRFYGQGDVANPAIKEPSVLYSSAVEWLKNEGVDAGDVSQSSLVHVPLYVFHYNYNQSAYTAIIDGSSGKVMAAEYPSKQELPYLVVGIGAAIIFFLEGMLMEFPEVVVAYLITAFFVVIAAVYVAEKV
jgi:DNA-directed RNA polymerase subunit RPC12/RpoP